MRGGCELTTARVRAVRAGPRRARHRCRRVTPHAATGNAVASALVATPNLRSGLSSSGIAPTLGPIPFCFVILRSSSLGRQAVRRYSDGSTLRSAVEHPHENQGPSQLRPDYRDGPGYAFPDGAASTAITSLLHTGCIAYPHAYFLPSQPETNVQGCSRVLPIDQLWELLEPLLPPWPDEGARSAAGTGSAVPEGRLVRAAYRVVLEGDPVALSRCRLGLSDGASGQSGLGSRACAKAAEARPTTPVHRERAGGTQWFSTAASPRLVRPRARAGLVTVSP